MKTELAIIESRRDVCPDLRSGLLSVTHTLQFPNGEMLEKDLSAGLYNTVFVGDTGHITGSLLDQIAAPYIPWRTL